MPLSILAASPSGSVRPPVSKSILHRTLFALALVGEEKSLPLDSLSADVKDTLSVLGALGMAHRYRDGVLRLFPSKPTKLVQVRASATSLRMGLPLLAAVGWQGELRLGAQLAARPHTPLVKTLVAHGYRIRGTERCWHLAGKLQPGMFHVETAKTSQYLSGLLMALPLLSSPSEICCSRGVSSGYVEMTLAQMANHGVEVTPTPNGYQIMPAVYRSGEVALEADWSAAAFWLGWAAMRGEVRLLGLRRESLQPDSIVKTWLGQMGAKVEWQHTQEGDVLCLCRQALVAGRFDFAENPDLFPIMAVVCAAAEGTSTLTGLEGLAYKESDRLRGVLDMLDGLGVSYLVQEGKLVVHGGAWRGATLRGKQDHRLVMAGAVALSCVGGSLTTPSAVAKSYPDFWKDYQALGGKLCD